MSQQAQAQGTATADTATSHAHAAELQPLDTKVYIVQGLESSGVITADLEQKAQNDGKRFASISGGALPFVAYSMRNSAFARHFADSQNAAWCLLPQLDELEMGDGDVPPEQMEVVRSKVIEMRRTNPDQPLVLITSVPVRLITALVGKPYIGSFSPLGRTQVFLTRSGKFLLQQDYLGPGKHE